MSLLNHNVAYLQVKSGATKPIETSSLILHDQADARIMAVLVLALLAHPRQPPSEN